jgi:peptidoglycan/LPS O-acetylase OafA/YrhL
MSLKRINYIDGIRGIAILLVFVAHLSSGVYPYDIMFFSNFTFFNGGGLIGVQLFFALSGYLITKNLLTELKTHGNLDFKLFYLRRIWRLYPVLILACIFYLVYALIFMESRLFIAALGDVFMAITYTTNLPIYPTWFPDLNWMSHTWSLSVEEQFYLIWPLLLWLMMKFISNKTMILTTLTIVAITILLRKLFPSLSYGLLRWDALMLGCLLNFIKVPKSKIIGLVSIFIIAIYTWEIAEPISNIDYLFTAITCAGFISQSEHMSFLNNKILVYFGKVSYSLYLWHFFFMRMGYPGYLNLTVSLILADISYRFFEVPILDWAKFKFNLIRSA